MTKKPAEKQQSVRHGLPLRVTLIAALLLLVGFGLLSSAVVVTSAMENSLISRIDDQLIDASQGWAREPRELRTGKDFEAKASEEPDELRPPSAFYVRSITTNGFVHGPPYSGSNTPDLPEDLDLGSVPVTINSVDPQGPQWRAVTVRNLFGSTVVAMDMSSVNSTVNQLIWLESGVGIVVLVLLGGLGYFIVRRSLRPLEEVEQTAAAIAAGDLHKRVPSWAGKTEVGRLSIALNGMLAQIQTAFAATAASEEAA
ncbi:MAG: HAMP domain-containing protein, partial [Mycobacteriaceae bacterium]